MPNTEIESAASALAGPCGGRETILLVEREAFVRKATAEVLASAGYRVVIASSSGEAIEALRKCFWPIHLLLSDVGIPGISSHDLAAEFQCLSPGGQVLWMSVKGEGLNCLSKPFSIQTLLKKVRAVLNTELYPAAPT